MVSESGVMRAPHSIFLIVVNLIVILLVYIFTNSLYICGVILIFLQCRNKHIYRIIYEIYFHASRNWNMFRSSFFFPDRIYSNIPLFCFEFASGEKNNSVLNLLSGRNRLIAPSDDKVADTKAIHLVGVLQLELMVLLWALFSWITLVFIG